MKVAYKLINLLLHLLYSESQQSYSCFERAIHVHTKIRNSSKCHNLDRSHNQILLTSVGSCEQHKSWVMRISIVEMTKKCCNSSKLNSSRQNRPNRIGNDGSPWTKCLRLVSNHSFFYGPSFSFISRCIFLWRNIQTIFSKINRNNEENTPIPRITKAPDRLLRLIAVDFFFAVIVFTIQLFALKWYTGPTFCSMPY